MNDVCTQEDTTHLTITRTYEGTWYEFVINNNRPNSSLSNTLEKRI